MGCGCKESKQKPNGGLARSQGQQRGGDRLKDVGDFDRLRRSIIQKLKNNEELREVITFIVKQSAALNLEGAENVKPRHLSEGFLHPKYRHLFEYMSQRTLLFASSP